MIKGRTKMNANGIDFKTCYLTEPGVFVKNKSCFVFQELDHFAFWLVIDGVDYFPDKDSAQLIVDQLCTDLAAISSLSRGYIRKCLNKAHLLLKNAGNGFSLKASLVLIVTDYSEMIWAVSGNSRLYLIRDCQFAFRSKDQSVAQSLVESDIITEDSINSVVDRDILTNYLGIEYGFAPFISSRFQLQDGDIIMLCNLGFWEQLHNETFKQLLLTVADSTELLPILKERFLDHDVSTSDDYIAGLIAVRKVLSHYRHGNFRLRLPLGEKPFVMILVALLGVGGLVGAWLTDKSKNETENKLKMVEISAKNNEVAAYEQKGDQFVNEAKYAEANLEYDQALNILSTYPEDDQDFERKIRLKISIILMLKDGDAFLTKAYYENALNRYETARDFDTFNYFRPQIETKLAKVRQLLNMQRELNPTPETTPNSPPESSKGLIDQTNAIIPNQPAAIPDPAQSQRPVNNARNPVPISVNNKTQSSKAAVKVSVASHTNRNVPKKPKVTAKVTKKVIKETKNSKQAEIINNPVAVNKATKKNAPPKNVVASADRKKLAKAVKYLKRGDELVGKKRFRQAINCYKRAQDIYLKLKMVVMATQLNSKIEVTRKKMRASFQGGR
jgi:serine/threonine protein phosphatase PrpC/tetratricopeptide (TPR) repeat protein